MYDTNVTFDSVFANAADAEKDFDLMFGAEEDNRLLDAVEESSASELPDDTELHQTDDDATPKDLADELGEDHDTDNAPDVDSSDAEELIDMASGEADKTTIADDKTGVEDQVKDGEPDVENLEDESDKAINKKFDESYASLMEELQEGEDPVEGDPGDTTEDMEEGCKKPVNEEDCDPTDPSCVDDIEDPIEDDEESVDDVEEGCKKKNACGEAASLPEESLVDQIEDKIIDDVENGKEDISGKELSDLEDTDDDDIIDMVEGK